MNIDVCYFYDEYLWIKQFLEVFKEKAFHWESSFQWSGKQHLLYMLFCIYSSHLSCPSHADIYTGSEILQSVAKC